MMTRIIPIDEKAVAADKKVLSEAAGLIRSGELVAFPTETVYGLGADAENPDASRKIYAAKGRPSDNPLIVHIADIERFGDAAAVINDSAAKLAKAFWPGPLTIILPKKECIPSETTGGLTTVAIRMPSHPVARALIRESGCMIAAPSANASGRPSPTTAAHVYEDLNGRIPLIIDGGAVSIGLESTIVDCTGDVPCILRPGYISREMIQKICGECHTDLAVSREAEDGSAGRDVLLHPKAPGMKYRHYAPKALLTIVEGEPDKVAEYINSKLREAEGGSKSIGVIASEENAGKCAGGRVIVLGSRNDEEEIASHLYAALREMDELGVDMIFAESFSEEDNVDGRGLRPAIMNRLTKAAGHRIVRV